MAKPAEALYHLQTLDTRLYQIEKRLALIRAELSQDAAVAQAEAAFTAARDRAHHWQTHQKDLELEQGQLKEEAAATETRLYSGVVTNPRELSDLQQKLAELNDRQAVLEEKLLEAMVEREASQAEEDSASSSLQSVRAERAGELGTLIEEQAALEAEQADTTAQRDEQRTALDAGLLRRYDALRTKPGAVAIAKSSGDTCGACGVEFTEMEVRQARRGEIINCTTCKRIAYIS